MNDLVSTGNIANQPLFQGEPSVPTAARPPLTAALRGSVVVALPNRDSNREERR
jgi:hypothetical protein